MPTLDTLGLRAALGEPLEQDVYKKDFRQRMSTIHGQDVWKLERRQAFREPGAANWEAFARGDWAESLRLTEARRESIRQYLERNRMRGVGIYRVRVVERPIIPYVQFELASLRVRAECGAAIRVVGPQAVEVLETDGKPLPELVSVGDETLYEIRYDATGVPDGAVRYADAELVARFRAACRELFDAGEDVRSFHAREVAHLPPPPAEHAEIQGAHR